MKDILKLQKALVIILLTFSSYHANSQTDVDTTVYVFAETMPEFPDGNKAMYSFIANEIRYPSPAVENNVAGKVYVSFIVETDGRISNIKVIKGIGSGCDEEAIRVVSLMPNWKPGMKEGKKVRVSTTIPFTFELISTKEEPIYNNADILPVFTDTITNFDYYIKTILRYPAGIPKEDIIDTVNILYVVEIDGSLSDVKLMDSNNTLNAFDHEAIRVINESSGNFTPGYIENKPVRIRLFVSVVFDYSNIDTSNCDVISYKYNDTDYNYFQQEEVTFTVVEEMPEFPGGMKGLMSFLNKNIKYPQEAKNNNEQGKVYVHFTIEKDGRISNAVVLRGVSPSLDAEALRVINNMPNWKPGMQRGMPARVGYNLPVKFSL